MHYRPSCGDCAVFGEIPVDMPEKDKRKFDLIVERQVDRLTSARGEPYRVLRQLPVLVSESPTALHF